MSAADETSRQRDDIRQAQDRVGGGDYAPGAAESVTLPRSDERREAQEREPYDPANADTDPDVLRDGGPASPRGVATTTGGTAGPAAVRRRTGHRGRKVAPTTTGDANTGGMSTPAGGATSDNASQASQVGNFRDR